MIIIFLIVDFSMKGHFVIKKSQHFWKTKKICILATRKSQHRFIAVAFLFSCTFETPDADAQHEKIIS